MNDLLKLIKFIGNINYEDGWQRIRNFSFLIGESAFDLGINLIIMIMVERALGPSGLGIFAYLLSVLIFAGFISDFGISRFLEREISASSNDSDPTQIIKKAYYAILATSTFCSVLFFFTAVSDTAHTNVEERVIAYFIIGITIPFRNCNRIRIAILQGSGKFDVSSKLKTWKRLFLFLATFFFLIWRLPPSILIAGYLAAEIGMLVKSRKAVTLPSIRNMWNKSRIRSTLEESYHYLLTDETLDVVLHLDFFILGLFVSSHNLGLYAEASILARMFLLVPISIKPIFRNRYCLLVAEKQMQKASLSIQKYTALLFYLHSTLALYILLFYPSIMRSLYHVQGKSLVPFFIFAEILPGLLFFSAITSQEPIYEAEDKIVSLQKIVILVSILNLVLNCFCIPFAGYYGAAFASSASMFVYFILFGRHLTSIFILPKFKYIVAGMAVYLTYMLFHYFTLSFAFTFLLVPAFLFLLFFAIGMFNFETGMINNQSEDILSETTHPKEV